MQVERNLDDRSLGELFGELSDEMRTLVRQEVELAKLEMSRKASKAGKDIAIVAIGGAVAYAGFLVLLATAVIAIAYALPWWLSALIVGVVTTGAGYVAFDRGLSKLRRERLVPEQTIASLKEDKEWASGQMT